MVAIHHQTQAGSPPNEDHVWAGERGAIVLDGTSGMTDRQWTDGDSDGRWYVETLSNEIQQRLPTGIPLTEIVATAIDRVDERMRELTGDADPAPHELPAAAGVILRWDDITLDYFVLGDCTLLIETHEEIQPVVGEGPRQLDQRVVDRMVTLREQGGDLQYRDLRDRVDSLLVEHRRFQNQPDGYWTLGFETEAVEHAETGHIPLTQLHWATAFTDGFEPIYSVFDVFADWEGLLSSLKANSLDRAVRLLRAFEAADPECEAFPRLKPSDDVGIVALDFQRGH